MKKFLLILSLSFSMVYGRLLSHAYFATRLDPKGIEMTLPMAALVFIVLWFFYQIVRDAYLQEAAIRMVEYEARRDAKFQEIDDNNLWLKLKVYAADFEDGRREL